MIRIIFSRQLDEIYIWVRVILLDNNFENFWYESTMS